MITKDEEIGKLRTNMKELNECKEEKDQEILKLKDELDLVKKHQISLEKSLESEKATALQEISRGKASALQALRIETEKRIEEINCNHEKDKQELLAKSKGEMEEQLKFGEREKQRALKLKDEELIKKLEEKDEEGRLALEHLELRLISMTNGEDSKTKLLQDLELKLKTSATEKHRLQSELSRLKEELNSVCSQIKSEFTEELETLKEKYNDVQDQLEKAKVELSQNKVSTKEERRKLEAEIETLKGQDVNNDQLIKLQSELKSKCDHAFNMESALKAIEDELEKQTQAYGKLEFERKESYRFKEDMEMKVIAMSKDLKSRDDLIESLKANHQTKIKDLQKQLEINLYNETEQLHLVNKAHEEFNSMAKSYEEQIKNLSKASQDKSSEIARLTLELESNKKYITEMKESNISKMSELEKSIHTKQNDLDSITEAMNSCNAIIHDLQESNKFLQGEKEDCSKKIDKLEKALQEERHKTLSAQHHLEQLQTKIDEEGTDQKATLKKAVELEKEIFDLKQRETLLKNNEQQMISYQKELQEQISTYEIQEETRIKDIENLNLIIETKNNELKEIATKKSEEVEVLKTDMEFKIRHMQDKEKTYKELQVQSIDYQKKLQEQLTEMEQEVLIAKSDVKSHSSETLKLSARIDELTQDLNNAHDNLHSKDNQIKDILLKIEVSKDEINELRNQNELLNERNDNLATTANQLEQELIKNKNEALTSKDDFSCLNNEMETELEELKKKLELTNQMLYNAQNVQSAKENELEELKSTVTLVNEENEGLKKDLKSSEDNKTAQMVEFEDSLVKLEEEIKKIKLRNEQLEEIVAKNRKMEEEKTEERTLQSQIENDHEQAVKILVKKFETEMLEKEEAADMEIDRIREESEQELRKTVQEYNLQIASLKQELYEKTALFDEMLETHQAELLAKQDELDQEVEACNRMYQARIAEVTAANELKLQLEQEEEQNSW